MLLSLELLSVRCEWAVTPPTAASGQTIKVGVNKARNGATPSLRSFARPDQDDDISVAAFVGRTTGQFLRQGL